jgi:hypothetical protein
MEAFRFGFAPDMPPAFKFDPTDDDIVAHYLLPRALGIPNPPFAHAVLDDNPVSLPPPDLLARHGHADSHHAFFLDVTKNGGRRERVIKGGDGGIWRGQQGQQHTLTLLSPGGHEMDIKYKRYDLTYKRFDDDDEQEEEEVKGKKRKRKNGNGSAPSGWVMHEYTVVSPPLQNTVLSRIHLTKGKIKENQLQAADIDQHHQVFPAPQQLVGPSYYQDDFAHQEQPHPSYYEDFPYQEQAVPSHLDMICGGNHGSQADDASFYGEEFPYQEQGAGSSYQHFRIPDQPGPSYYHHHADGGTGFSDGSNADDASFYGEENPYQQHAGPIYQGFPAHEQPIPSYYLMGGGGEGFSDGIQADDASFYADNGGVTGDGFVNLLCAGDGLAGNSNFCDDGFHFTSGGDMEFKPSGHCATQDTYPSKTDS